MVSRQGITPVPSILPDVGFAARCSGRKLMRNFYLENISSDLMLMGNFVSSEKYFASLMCCLSKNN
jgi:hypothetical protein